MEEMASETLFTLYNESNACYFNSAVQLLSRCNYPDPSDPIVKIIRRLQVIGNSSKAQTEKRTMLEYINNRIAEIHIPVVINNKKTTPHRYSLHVQDVNTEMVSTMISLMSEANKQKFVTVKENINIASMHVIFCVFDSIIDVIKPYLDKDYITLYIYEGLLPLTIVTDGGNYELKAVVYNPRAHFITNQRYADGWKLVNDNLYKPILDCEIQKYYNVRSSNFNKKHIDSSVLVIYIKQGISINLDDKLCYEQFQHILVPASTATVPVPIQNKIDYDETIIDGYLSITEVTGLDDKVKQKLKQKTLNKLRSMCVDNNKVSAIVKNVVEEYVDTGLYVFDVISNIIHTPDFVNWFVNYYHYRAATRTDRMTQLYLIIINGRGKNKIYEGQEYYSSAEGYGISIGEIHKEISIIETWINTRIVTENLISTKKVVNYFNYYMTEMFGKSDYMFWCNDEILYFGHANGFEKDNYIKYRSLFDEYSPTIYIKKNTCNFDVNSTIKPSYEMICGYYEQVNDIMKSKPELERTYENYIDELITVLLRKHPKLVLSDGQKLCLQELNIPMLILYLV